MEMGLENLNLAISRPHKTQFLELSGGSNFNPSDFGRPKTVLAS